MQGNFERIVEFYYRIVDESTSLDLTRRFDCFRVFNWITTRYHLSGWISLFSQDPRAREGHSLRRSVL
ncbi:hypothetical protein OUZ56_017204 [Daphnia magna]|uniref:Uncharacterized protein n=1 Tax=Daphnia magna TaxID=35525 RepID=A0ABR0ASG5_9CRUS|nr:hypothetical protein OUZ56_017204 [Daphnia magna]